MKSCKYLILLAIAVIGITACNDEDFSSSPSLSLTFSTDTVKFDTIFSKVPTSTRTMWVYNRSGKDLRCTNVRLLNGNQTGYRVNVDGVYLSPAAGYQMQDVEIRNKDSLRVFVELTSPKNGKLVAQELIDKLLFTLESGNTQELVLDAFDDNFFHSRKRISAFGEWHDKSGGGRNAHNTCRADNLFQQ